MGTAYTMRPPPLPKPRIFVSYHHALDQWYYNEFSRFFCSAYDVATDCSLRGSVDSDDSEYIMRRIRKDYIEGTSCTVVLCGSGTSGRRFVDWEIKATLDDEHGLVGVRLPTNVPDAAGNWSAPGRLVDNFNTGYATVETWEELTVARLQAAVHLARARPAALIDNTRPLRRRSV